MRTQLQAVKVSAGWVAPDRPVAYDLVFDEYHISCQAGSFVQIIHCPWCGIRLPDSKRARWYASLEALGLHPDDPDVPDDFHSDAWWTE